jgi:nucleotide-binding universal stress UspA family protein
MEYPGATDSFAFDFEAYQARTITEMHDFLTPLKVQHETVIVSGTAPHEIENTAEKFGVSLVVMGTRGLKGVAHRILGSSTEHVIHHLSVPIFTVSPHCVAPSKDEGKRHVLLPTSSLERPPRGYILLRQIVEELGDKVTLMHVVDFKDPMFGVSYSVHPFNVTAYETTEKEKQLLQAGSLMVADESKLKAMVRFGDASEEILLETSRHEYDLVLMGVRKEGLLGRLFDSTAYRVICKSPVPVITLKAD